jgi:hypothetical protein
MTRRTRTTRNPEPEARNPNRTCGECRACCITLGFEAVPGESGFTKPPNSPCRHLIQIGCEIYTERPPVCRRFECAWISAPNLPAALRPDRCGVLFCTNDHPDGGGYAVFAYELRPGAVDAALPQWLIEQVVHELPVFIVRPGQPVEVLEGETG